MQRNSFKTRTDTDRFAVRISVPLGSVLACSLSRIELSICRASPRQLAVPDLIDHKLLAKAAATRMCSRQRPEQYFQHYPRFTPQFDARTPAYHASPRLYSAPGVYVAPVPHLTAKTCGTRRRFSCRPGLAACLSCRVRMNGRCGRCGCVQHIQSYPNENLSSQVTVQCWNVETS